MEKFKVGDHAWLKTEPDVPMCVHSFNEHGVYCWWFNANMELEQATFPEDMLDAAAEE